MPKQEQQTQRDRERFYGILNRLEHRVGKQLLRDCHGRLNWPRQGVYFFYENGEFRRDSAALRVVRIGTHALTATSRTKLWKRLRQHRGTKADTGNHRGSIFRGHVGRALLNKGALALTPDTWQDRSSASGSIVENEENVERAVSAYIGAMPFLWIRAEDDHVGRAGRALIEAGAIGLLSSLAPTGGSADAASPDWLGRYSVHEAVRDSHLWNVRHVDSRYDPSFLDVLEECADRTAPL